MGKILKAKNGKKRYEIKTGDRYKRWVVVDFSHTGNRGAKFWNCLCDCGVEKKVYGYSLHSGDSKSCGCYNKEKASSTHTKHGYRSHLLYGTWQQMLDRCYNPKNSHYYLYGDVGTIVCERWKNSIKDFIDDMGKRPVGMSLDRINTFGNYEKSNCRWASASVQAINQKPTKGGTSKYKGVSWAKRERKWMAQLVYNRKQKFIGYFENEKEAALAYDRAIYKIHKENAYINFPKELT